MRGIRLTVLWAVMGLTLLAGARARAGQDPQPTSESQKWARLLWEQAIAAKGGREHLDRVQSLAIFDHTEHGKFSRKGGLAFGVTLWVFPDKMWTWSDLRPSPLGGSAHMFRAEWGPNSRFFFMREQLFYLMETKWLRPIPVSARKEVLEGVRVDVVRAEVQDGYDAEFVLDPQTHLPREVRFGKHEEKRLPPWNALSLSDYAPCQGIQMPRQAKWFELDPWQVSYIINPEYDAAILDRPARFEDGPDAWRPKGGTKKPIVRCN
jgi:hypothetical protein